LYYQTEFNQENVTDASEGGKFLPRIREHRALIYRCYKTLLPILIRTVFGVRPERAMAEGGWWESGVGTAVSIDPCLLRGSLMNTFN